MAFETFLNTLNATRQMGDEDRQFMTQQRDDRNRREVGGLMASGDYAGASRAAYGAGDLRTGALADERGASIAEAQRKREIGTKIGTGDYAGARQDAYSDGDLDLGQHIDGWLKTANDQQKADAAKRAEDQAKIAVFLKGLPAEQRKGWAAANAPALAQTYEVSPEQVAAVDLSDVFLDQQIAEASSFTDMLARERQTREDALKREQFGETQRHNRATEGVAVQREGRLARSGGRGGGGMKLPGGFVLDGN